MQHTVFRLLIMGLLIYSSTCLAQAQQSELLFKQGMRAFNLQDYQAALHYFQQAQRLGMLNKRLPYNTGVTFYKLGDYGAAYEILKDATSDPDLAAVAYFNMGLAALKMTKADLAKDNFQLSYTHAINNEQRQLATRMLKKLGASNSGAFSYTLNGSLSGSFGYNDNVTLNATDDLAQKSEEGDTYYSFYAKLNQSFSSSLFADIALYTLQYVRLIDYNYTLLNASVGYKIPYNLFFSTTNLTASGKVQSLFLDNNKNFQNLQLIQLDADYTINPATSVTARYQFSNIESTTNRYDHLTGNRQRLRIFGKYLHSNLGSGSDSDSGLNLGFKYAIHWFYEYEINDREDVIGNNNEVISSFSPTRNKLGFKQDIRLSRRFNFQWGWQYWRSDFADANQIDVNTQITRKDSRKHANLRLIYRLNKRIWIYTDYSYLKNKSNIEQGKDDYNYQSNNISLSLYWN